VDNRDPGRTSARSAQPEPDSIRTPENKSDLTPRFKLIFSTMAALTVLALILNVLLAMLGDGSEQVQAAAEACSTTYKMGFGAIVGLIGGRVA
jgi:hypothetical protein